MPEIDVYIVSDSTGETGDAIAHATLYQFPTLRCHYLRYPEVVDQAAVDRFLTAMEESGKSGAQLVFLSLMQADVHHRAVKELRVRSVPFIDLYEEPISCVAHAFNVQPLMQAGMSRRLTETYFDKISSMEFAVRYDDGRDPRGFLLADLVLVGVSRTSKTPLSLFLATKGYQVANLPLVPELDPPAELFEMDPGRIVGLIVNEDQLRLARTARLHTLGLEDDSSYVAHERIDQELHYARSLFKRLDCPVFDVSDSAIEKTAARIVSYLHEKFGDQAQKKATTEAF